MPNEKDYATPNPEWAHGSTNAASQLRSDLQNIGSRPQSFGEKAVGLSFNPSGDDAVNQAKNLYAQIIDQLNNLRSTTESGEVKRLCSAAITEAQGAQMWAVKAITWKD